MKDPESFGNSPALHTFFNQFLSKSLFFFAAGILWKLRCLSWDDRLVQSKAAQLGISLANYNEMSTIFTIGVLYLYTVFTIFTCDFPATKYIGLICVINFNRPRFSKVWKGSRFHAGFTRYKHWIFEATPLWCEVRYLEIKLFELPLTFYQKINFVFTSPLRLNFT